MYRTAFRLARVGLVWAIVLSLTVDTALACGLLARLRGRHHRAARPAHCCASAAVVVEQGVDKDWALGGESAYQKDLMEGIEFAPPELGEPTPAPEDAWELPEEPKTPAEPEQPADIAPPTEAEPTVEPEPATTLPPPDEAEPEPAAEMPEEPAAEMPEEPAAPEEPLDDLFEGLTPAAPDDTEKPPVQLEPPAAPAEPAAPQKQPPAKDSLDDLFPTEPAQPAPAPAPKDALDELFGTPSPAPAKPKAKPDPLDDLFQEPAPKPAPAPAPATPPAKSKPAAKPAASDDPFSGVETAQPQELAMRQWTDNTGAFTVYARLVELSNGKVRLQKHTGRTCTVDLDRLSAPDAAYVQAIFSSSQPLELAAN